MTLTRDAVLAMSERERDAAVAEHILGWTGVRVVLIDDDDPDWAEPVSEAVGVPPEWHMDPLATDDDEPCEYPVPCFSRDAAADLSVLERVRTWEPDAQDRFVHALYGLYDARWDDDPNGARYGVGRMLHLHYYQTGDYAMAALLARCWEV